MLWEVSRVVSIDALLDGHEVAVRARVEQLRSQLADAERVLEDVAITRRTLELVLAGRGSAAEAAGGAAAVPGPGRRMGAAPQVVVRAEGMSCEALPAVYQQVWSAVADSAEGLRSVQVCRAVGVGAGPNDVELMRSRLKRLVQRGWLAEPAPGLFRLV